jgi:very-short-patch-repair endonuclease
VTVARQPRARRLPLKVAVSRSRLEDILANRIQIAGLPEPVREYRFARPRLFRADFAWPELGVLAEVEGGIWTGGRHTRGVGFQNDCQKQNIATVLGFRVVRFTEAMIESGEAIDVLTLVLR